MRIVITLDIEGVEKDKTAIFVGEKPEGPIPFVADIPGVPKIPAERVTFVPAVEPIGETTAPAEVIPQPKKRGRKRKTVSIETPEQQETRELQEAAARELLGISEPAIKADIPTPTTGSEPAPAAAPEPVPEPAIKAAIPNCPTCKEPMTADERYDAYLCVKDGQFNNTVKPSQVNRIPTTVTVVNTTPVVPEVKPTATQAVLTEEEQKTIKARLGKYWVSVLPEAGMTADDGKSINAKLTQFANTFAEGREWPNSRAWNAKQWDVFLGFMDGMVGAKGAKALVAHINQEIGSK